MSATARVRAQAKVNLFLRILAREASGYHGLETLFARIELADEITVRADGSTRSVDCRSADVGPAESNLAYRAASAYAEATGWPTGFAIEIEKRIPVGGGLGGGSADAGAVLRALNALAPRPAPPRTLMTIAGRLGADVPFLTMEAPLALAWGRGDRLLALPPLPARDVGLVCFPFGVSSAAAFGWVAESRARQGTPIPASRLSLADLESWEGVSALAGNDFEDVVTRRHDAIAGVLSGARARRALIAELTGSGATVVVVPRDGADLGELPLPSGAVLVRTRSAVSVEDVGVTG
jgi:4-diphosphocytidyl-2-C-methyl-D-erythritol kinase